MTRTILITRPRPAADDLADTLRVEGFSVYVQPLMTIEDLQAQPPSAPPQDVILTSQNAIAWCARSLRLDQHRFHVVGTHTAGLLHQQGATEIATIAPDAATLITKLEFLSPRPMLYPCGQEVSVDIGALLAPLGFVVQAIPVYAARALTMDHDVWQKIWRQPALCVPLFSRRTAQLLAATIEKTGCEGELLRHQVLCLSDQVAEAVRDLPWHGVRVSPQPDAACMLTELRRMGITDKTP